MERLLLDLSINTTAMFRDPTFYLAFRQKIVPMLRTYPFVRIWHAGCSTGEEVYSMAILLQEEGLYDRCRIYATDINEAVLQRAKDGIFPLTTMQENTSNYIAAGGTGTFSRVLHGALRLRALPSVAARERRLRAAQPRHRRVVQRLQRDLLPQRPDLLQQRAAGARAELFLNSLEMFGILGLGKKETIRYTAVGRLRGDRCGGAAVSEDP